MKLEFYNDALELLAQSDHWELILDHDAGGNKIDAGRLVWYSSLAIEQGKIPLVGYLDTSTDNYVVTSQQSSYILYIPRVDL